MGKNKYSTSGGGGTKCKQTLRRKLSSWKRPHVNMCKLCLLLESFDNPLVPAASLTDGWAWSGLSPPSGWRQVSAASACGFYRSTPSSEQAASHQKGHYRRFATFQHFSCRTWRQVWLPTPQRAAANMAATQRETSALWQSPQRYRVSIFRKSETLPVWFWECWYCLCCCCGCACGCCWMYPTVLCCGTLVACKNAGVEPPCTSPWVICGRKRECDQTWTKFNIIIIIM